MSLIVSLFALLATISISSIEGREGNETHFYNPIVEYYSPDPYIYLHDDGYYYFSHSDNSQLTVLRSPILTDWSNAEKRVVHDVQPGYGDIWAPEIHYVRGAFYIYFAMWGGGTAHRMYVSKSANPNDPMGEWEDPIRMMPDENEWAIDGTVLQYGNGQIYFLWSAWPREDPVLPSNGSLYIAPMSDPMTVSSSRILLREPTAEWETAPVDEIYIARVNEGPQILQHNNRTFVVFSANGAWTPNYCLGIFGIDYLKDPLVPSNWWDDVDHCVFERNDAEYVYTTGHASFTFSPDRSEWWMVYHATPKISPPGELQEMRSARAEKFDWDNVTGLPVFPKPHSVYYPLEIPKGQPHS